jgi:hypothetical protein
MPLTVSQLIQKLRALEEKGEGDRRVCHVLRLAIPYFEDIEACELTEIRKDQFGIGERHPVLIKGMKVVSLLSSKDQLDEYKKEEY